MSLFKCKMCGAGLEIDEGSTVVKCEYCGTKQTLPRLTDSRIENLYDRANHFRRTNDYDKALNMLLSGLEKYDEYYPQGMALGIEEDMDYCRNKIVNALYDDYGMNLNDAYDMIALDNTEYQIQIIEKSKEFNSKE